VINPANNLSPLEENVRREIELRNRELDLREREVAATEREVAAKEEELRRSRWSNPLVIGLLAAAVGLLGNLIVAIINDRAAQDAERRRAKGNLVIELVRTGNTETAIKNLKFFLDRGLLDDPDNSIRNALNNEKTVPVLPPSTIGDTSALGGVFMGLLQITSDPPGATITIDGKTTPGLTNLVTIVSVGQHEVSLALGNKRSDNQVVVSQGHWTQLHAVLR
jgi:hypothetical protein